LLLAAIVWHASLRRPTGPEDGFSIQGELSDRRATQETLRFATFNIHSGKGADGHYDLERVAQCLAGMDFVALNEVRGWSYARPPDQLEILGRRRGMGWLFAPAEHRWFCQQFGNGLLSSHTVQYWQRIPLPCRDGRSHRNALLAVVPYKGGLIRVLITHVTRHTEEARKAQLRSVGELFLALEEPAILVGDMNSPAADPLMAKIIASPGVIDPLRQAGKASENIIDWILARGFRTVDAGVLDNGASDHPMIWAELAPLDTCRARGPALPESRNVR